MKTEKEWIKETIESLHNSDFVIYTPKHCKQRIHHYGDKEFYASVGYTEAVLRHRLKELELDE